MPLLAELRLTEYDGFYKYFVPTGLRRLSYSASSGLSQTAAKEDSEIFAAASTNSRSSLFARKSTKSATSAIISGGNDLIFSSSSLSCINAHNLHINNSRS
jgi:hypothetical protein